MNTYAVKYLDGTDLKVAYVQGGNQSQAGKEFSEAYPGIGGEKILEVVNIKGKSGSYSTAIGVAAFISFLGWIAVLAGIALVFTGTFLLVGVSGTISIIASGFMLIVGGQITRATAQSANYSRQMLDEMRYGR